MSPRLAILTTLALLLASLAACGPAARSGEGPDAPPDTSPHDMAGPSPDLAAADLPDTSFDTPADLDASDMATDLPPPTPLSADAGPALQALVGEPVTLDGSASTGAVSYQWSPGGMLDALPESDSPTATFTYDTPGRYRAVLTVRDASGKKRTDLTLVSVTRPAQYPQKHSSSVLAIPGASPDVGQVAIVERDSRALSIFTRQQGALTLARRITLDGEPRQLSHDAGWLAVTTRTPARVELFSLADLSRSYSVALPARSRPHGVLLDGGTLLVALQATGEVWRARFDGQSAPRDITRHAALSDVRSLTLLPEDRVLATRWRSTEQEAQTLVFERDSPDDATLWTLGVDTRPSSDTESSGVPNYLDQAVHSPTEPRLFLPSTQANVVEGLYRNGVDPEHDTALRAILSEVDSRSGEHHVEERVQFDGRGLASAAAFSARGDYLYVAMRGSRTVERLDVLDGGADSGTLFEVGYAPEGLALTEDDRYLLVDATLSRELVVYDTATLDRDPTPIARLSTVDAEPLSEELLLGKRLFNDSFDRRITADGYIACAHCHLEGESDHLTWDFTDRGEGMRNTTSLMGRRGAGHGPIHWSGNFDEPQDFEHDIREHFGGEGFLTDEQYASHSALGAPKAGLSPELDALAAYMTSLESWPQSPYLLEDGALSDAARRGEALFQAMETGCTTCHGGSAFTDSRFLGPGEPLLHDVGTLTAASGMRIGALLMGIDTPTLYELWNSAPYLHDGSAPTLRDVLTTHNPSDLHGKTSHLTDAQLDDLVAYLQSL